MAHALSAPQVPPDLPPIDFQGVGAVLAVAVALYALLIQARRSTLTLTTIILICLLSSVLALAVSGARVLSPIILAVFGRSAGEIVAYWLAKAGDVALLLFALFLSRQLLKDYAVQKYHRADAMVVWKRTGERLKSWLFANSERPIVRNPRDRADFKTDFLTMVFRRYFYVEKNDDFRFLNTARLKHQSVSVSAVKAQNRTHNEEVAQLALYFLYGQENTFVEFVSCTRHPIEFMEELISAYAIRHSREKPEEPHLRATDGSEQEEEAWVKRARELWTTSRLRERLVLVDAHTPHFGFDEAIYREKTREARRWALDVVTSGNSYPGIHTALVDGFKMLSPEPAADAGRFGVIIFEDLSALIDIDSAAQFRLFVRHVVASERLMRGILTVFYEEKSAFATHPFLPEVVDRHFAFHGDHDIAYAPWEIADQVEAVTRRIRLWIQQDVPGGEKLLLVKVMNGGALFSSDLEDELRRLDPEHFEQRVEVVSLGASSYAGKTTAGGPVALDVPSDFPGVAGRTVLVVDDICHTGHTLKEVERWLISQGAKDVRSIVVIQRPNAEGKEAFYKLFDFKERYGRFPNAWMYGYGMDDEAKTSTRRLPCVVFKARDGGDLEEAGEDMSEQDRVVITVELK